MLKAIIVEDEINAREFLEKLIARKFSDKITVIDAVSNIKDAVSSIKEKKPNLVFLDIQLGNEKGFDLFNHIPYPNFEVIFTTAYQNYAIDAIRYSAFDYLLKPINQIDLLSSIKRLEDKLSRTSTNERLELLLENLSSESLEYNKIAIPTDKGYELIKINEILYAEADGNYANIYTLSGKKMIISKALKYLEEILPQKLFNRIHKSYLVNLNQIKTYNKSENILELTNGLTLPVASRKHESLVKQITHKA